MAILLGAIADDYTGATDLANTLVKAGMPTIQTFGIPDRDFDLGNAAAVVVALKSRSMSAPEAVQESLAALDWLRSIGTKQFFFKYCSTFDSTDNGNIGPVADTLLESLNEELTIVCPAFPKNKRTVYKGHLFVGDQLLSDSTMKDHPLTPMTDANLVRVLGKQSAHRVGLVELNEVRSGIHRIEEKYEQLKIRGYRYAVVDAVSEEDLFAIGSASRSLKLITGGSGVALGLPENFRLCGDLLKKHGHHIWQAKGRTAVLSGSCSAMTRAQIEFVKNMWPGYKIDPISLAKDKNEIISNVLNWVDRQNSGEPLLIYSSADPAQVSSVQRQLGRENAGELIEQAMGSIARGLVKLGFQQLIVAGGETSGAIVKNLKIKGLRIGREITPGVPWCLTIGPVKLSLALKSGNFGEPDFFIRSFELLNHNCKV